MPGLVPGILFLLPKQDVDGRDKPGHDELGRYFTNERDGGRCNE